MTVSRERTLTLLMPRRATSLSSFCSMTQSFESAARSCPLSERGSSRRVSRPSSTHLQGLSGGQERLDVGTGRESGGIVPLSTLSLHELGGVAGNGVKRPEVELLRVAGREKAGHGLEEVHARRGDLRKRARSGERESRHVGDGGRSEWEEDKRPPRVTSLSLRFAGSTQRVVRGSLSPSLGCW